MTDCYDCDGTGIMEVPITDRERVAAEMIIQHDPDLADESLIDLKRGYRTTRCSFCGGSGQDPAAR